MPGSIAKLKKYTRMVEEKKCGYNQSRRFDFLDLKNNTIRSGKDGDCSAFAAGIVALAGYPIDMSKNIYSGNIVAALRKAGFTIYKYKSKSQVRAGDVIVAPYSHVCSALTATRWLSAQSDERGRRSGGAAGDQTGREVVIRDAYDRSGGWDYICRPPADVSVKKAVQLGHKQKIVTVTESHLAASLIAVGSPGTRNKIQTDAGYVDTSLKSLANGLTITLSNTKLSAHGIATFAATMLQESAWLRTTVEYGYIKKSYDPYRGRTFEQVTHKSNYASMGKWCVEKGILSDPDYFVNNPESLSELKWAWLGGLWYFSYRGLWGKANAGDFQRVQNAVNLGTPYISRVPSGWMARLKAYRAFISAYDKPPAIPVTSQMDRSTWKRLQQFIGAAIDGEPGAQTRYLMSYWLERTGKFDIKNKSDVKALQRRIGADVDGIWYTTGYTPGTTQALQKYLNKHR